MNKNHLIIAVFLFLAVAVNAQKSNDSKQDKKFSPYELLTSYYNNDFKPFKKGSIYSGVSMSLEDRSMENTEGLFQKTIEGNRVNFNILFRGGYYINDYSMVGLNLTIFENKFEGTLFKDPDTIASNSITRGFSFTPNFRTSIPLTENERLSFFTAVGMTFGKSNSVKRDIKNTDEIEKSYADNYNIKLGLSPGVTFFAMENFALEAQLDVIGYEFSVKKNKINEIDISRDTRHNVDFNINLLTLKLGAAYYF